MSLRKLLNVLRRALKDVVHRSGELAVRRRLEHGRRLPERRVQQRGARALRGQRGVHERVVARVARDAVERAHPLAEHHGRDQLEGHAAGVKLEVGA